jgi:hypothetical protein
MSDKSDDPRRGVISRGALASGLDDEDATEDDQSPCFTHDPAQAGAQLAFLRLARQLRITHQGAPHFINLLLIIGATKEVKRRFSVQAYVNG